MVRVAFTVDVDGSVKDPVVVSSTPTGIFDYAMLSAIRHRKFETRIVNGKPRRGPRNKPSLQDK